MLTDSTLYYVPLPGSDMLACHYMVGPVVDLRWVDQHCCQLLPKHISRFVSYAAKSH